MDVALVFLPLIAAAIAGLFGRFVGERGAQAVTCLAMLASLALAGVVFNDVSLHGHTRTTEVFTWFQTGSFEAHWALRVDQLTPVMLILVTGASSLVHVYSIGYMNDDPSVPRFQS